MNTLERIRKNTNGKMFAGIILLYLGVLFLLRNTGVYVPDWTIGWPLILLTVGIFSAIKNDFKRPRAYYMILFGLFFLAKGILWELGIDIEIPIFPLLIIAVGIHLVLGKFKPVQISSGD
jgi:hypothetical protein